MIQGFFDQNSCSVNSKWIKKLKSGCSILLLNNLTGTRKTPPVKSTSMNVQMWLNLLLSPLCF